MIMYVFIYILLYPHSFYIIISIYTITYNNFVSSAPESSQESEETGEGVCVIDSEDARIGIGNDSRRLHNLIPLMYY